MELLKRRLKDNYQLSNYQIAQLEFFFKSIFSDVSKLLIMGIIFHDRLGFYFIALFVMLFLRSSTGGLHFYTYVQCLLASVLYLWLAIVYLPGMRLPGYVQILMLLASFIICYLIGPVVSKYRVPPTGQTRIRFRNITCIFIFIYALLLYIIPEHPYMRVGFWVIILHSLQLIIAKIRKKGEAQNA